MASVCTWYGIQTLRVAECEKESLMSIPVPHFFPPQLTDFSVSFQRYSTYILFLTSSYILGNCLNTNAGYGKQIYAFKHSFCVCFT